MKRSFGLYAILGLLILVLHSFRMSDSSLVYFHTDPVNEAIYEKVVESNEMVAEGWLLNGKRDRYWKFYQNGKITQEGHYEMGLKVGYWKYYDSDGNLLKAGHFEDDMASEWWVDYDKKGNKIIESEYVDDHKHGLSIYYRNDRPYKAEKYQNGHLIKTWTELSSFIKDNS